MVHLEPARLAPFGTQTEAEPSAAYCTCRYGRDHDGSEFGPCEYCERVADDEAAHKRLTLDALRWRLTQRPGYFVNRSYEFDETESNVVVVYLAGEKAGCGRTVQEAVDCALYLTAEHGDAVPFAVLLGHWRKHYRSRWDGKAWVKPPAPRFELSDDGTVCLSVAPHSSHGGTPATKPISAAEEVAAAHELLNEMRVITHIGPDQGNGGSVTALSLVERLQQLAPREDQ